MARRNELRYIQYYVGTAAPKLIPQQPKKKNKTSLPKVEKKKSYTVPVDPLALGGILVSVAMLILMVVGFAELRTCKQELAQMSQSVQMLHERNADLQEEYADKCDLEVVEKAAVGLGMIPADEVEHITISVTEPETHGTTIWERIGVFLEGLMA